MFRFVACLAEPSLPDAQQTARRVEAHLKSARKAWRTVHFSDRLTVWCAGESAGRMEAHALASGGGVILGQLYSKRNSGSHSARIDDLDAWDSAKSLATGGQHLVDNFWGRYVAFLDDRITKTTQVVRDPSAALPCYWVEHESARIFFSDVADVASLAKLRLTVNYEYLTAHALLPQFQKLMTGLDGVTEILAAEAVGFASIGQERRRFLWNPYEVANTDPIFDRETASKQLREVIIDATGALGRSYDAILTNVGGLDSSIVLSCLAESAKGTALTGLNMATPSAKGDESFYALKAASHAGVPLRQGVFDPAQVDLRRVKLAEPQPSPMVMFDCTSPAGRIYEIAEEVEAQAIFYGVGGDNIFFQMPHILSALDYVRTGIGRFSLPRVSIEAAQYGNTSYAFTLLSMLQEKIRPKPTFEFIYKLVSPMNRLPFINPALIEELQGKETLHPMLLPQQEDAPKGKTTHVLASALLGIPYYDHWRPDYGIERICPLLSQKVVEVVLRIPTWQMVCGGVDRGLARKAFAGMLPPEVLHRTSKSRPDELYERVHILNQSFIKEALLDGELVRRRILNRPSLELLLQAPIPASLGPALALEFFSWEMWAQHWNDRD